jgi:transcriptional regulator with XRE-family HTH domain
MNFADQLKQERKRLGITQAQAASLLSIAKRTYCDWEYGITTPPEVAQEGALARLRKAKLRK